MRDQLNFLRQWCAAPLQVASLIPSGRSLSRLMTEGIDATSGPILELGPGTGVFTRTLIERGVPEEQIALVELNPNFASTLAKRHPKAQVHCMSAAEIEDQPFFDSGVSTVISGLGLLAMPKSLIEAILLGALHHLKPGGSFVQFTYGSRCPIPQEILQNLGLTSEHVGRIRHNIPPASVYRITRRRDL